MADKITDLQGNFALNNGIKMPYFGLGVFQSEDATNSVISALDCGYRHIDTASIYNNESEVGNAIRQHGINRKDIFVVSKVWNSDQGYDTTIKALNQSLERLKMDYLDLYLIHWPVQNKFVDTWKALEHLYEKGLVKAIGVSNFMRNHLDELLPNCTISPMVNQMEFHPYLLQQDLVDFCTQKGIQYEAWSPLMRGKILEINLLKKLAEKYGKTIVQIVLRWNLQKGIVTIPKSSNPERIKSNADIFDFELTQVDMDSIDSLDRNSRIGPDPNNFDF
jgi:diketogulonate reductase-like aldo/keto reductase